MSLGCTKDEQSFCTHRSCQWPNLSTTPITAIWSRQCLPLSVVHLKGKHCRKPHCCIGVVDTFAVVWTIFSKNVDNKKCAPKLEFFNGKQMRKIGMIFDVQN